MAIRSYTYKNYPFSPDATKFSKKKAEYKARGNGVASIMCCPIISLIAAVSLSQMLAFDNDTVVILGGLVVGIWAGIDFNRMIYAWYDQKINNALLRDLQKHGLPPEFLATLDK